MQVDIVKYILSKIFVLRIKYYFKSKMQFACQMFYLDIKIKLNLIEHY